MRLPTMVIHSARHPEGRAVRLHGFVFYQCCIALLWVLLVIPCFFMRYPHIPLFHVGMVALVSALAFYQARWAFKHTPLVVPPPPMSAHQQVQFLARAQQFRRWRPYRIRWTLTH